VFFPCLIISLCLGLLTYTLRIPSSGVIDYSPPELLASRWLVAAPRASGEVGLSWRYDSDTKRVGYNVYRSITPSGGYVKLNVNPVTTTSYVDSGLINGQTYYYIVRAVDANGLESLDSNIAQTQASSQSGRVGVAARINIATGISGDPWRGWPWGGLLVADLDGDGYIEFLLAGWNGGTRIFKVYRVNGSLLWENTHNNPNGRCHYWEGPICIWDIDRDGFNEVITDYYEGGKWYVAVRNGATGSIKTMAQLMARPYRAFQVADFRGVGYPQDLYVTVHPSGGVDDEVHDGAYVQTFKYEGGQLLPLWTAGPFSGGDMCHLIMSGDVNGDGYDELMTGQILLDHNGKQIWYRDLPRSHADSLWIGQLAGEMVILRGSEGAGGVVSCLDRYGNVKWQYTVGSGDAHRIWVAKLRTDYPDRQVMFYNEYGDLQQYVLSKDGNFIIMVNVGDQDGMTILWRGGDTEEIYGMNSIKDAYGNLIHTRNVLDGLECNCVADVIGDYREEYIAYDENTREIVIRTNADYNPLGKLSLWEDPKYLENMVSRWIW